SSDAREFHNLHADERTALHLESSLQTVQLSNISRSSRLRIFPVAPFGRASRITIWEGTLYSATRPRHQATRSGGRKCIPVRATTKALTTSPNVRSGTPITAHSWIASWV